MTQIAPGLPPLETSLTQPGDPGMGSNAQSFADWLRSAAPVGLKRAEDFIPDGVAVALPDIAKIFNEDGFFSGSPLTFAEPMEIATIAKLCASTADAPLASPDPHLSPGTTPAVPATSSLALSDSHASSLPPLRLAPLPGASTLITTPSAPASEANEAAPPLEAEMQSEVPIQGSASRLPPPAAQTRSALRIAIRDLERGLQIIVAAHALDARERERLASEIAGLLSRHGLLPGEVRVTGAARGPTRRNG